MQHAYTLVVLTLLQLCRAEIPQALPEWYAANLINDAGYPKPITEIFTTPDTFSSKNPIIVTSTEYNLETGEGFSTLPASTQTQSTSTEQPPFSDDTTRGVIPLREDRPSSSQPNESSSQVFSSQATPTREIRPTSSQPLDIEVQTRQAPPQEKTSSSPTQPLDMPRQMYQPPPQQIQVLVAQPQIQPSQLIQPSPIIQAAPIPPSPQLPPAPNPPCPQTMMATQSVNQHQTTGQPNYFLIYQQAPLSIQQYPESVSQSRQSFPLMTQSTTQSEETQRTTLVATQTTTTQPPPTTEVQTRITSSPTTQNPTSPQSSNAPRNIRQEKIEYWQDPGTARGATYTNLPINPAIPFGTFQIPCLNASSPEKNVPALSTISPTQRQNGKSGLTIRVTAPRGSITNIKINPSTTTKKPSTRRPQRKKGNNYNNCVDSCKGRKEPLCAAPLAVLPIDPDKLRGFPSICHLACHNSFRKNQPYEKVMDGRCSRLRTRIRTFDKNKLKREELNKAQYTVLNNVPETIVQVIQNERSGVY